MPRGVPVPNNPYRRPVGRRSRLNDEIIRGLAESIAAGNSIKVACERMGVDVKLVHRWRARGQAEIDRLDAHPDAIPYTLEAPYRALSDHVTRAMADCEAGRIVRILEAGRPHEVVRRTETTRTIVLQRHDANGRRQDEVQQVTDVAVTTTTEFDWRANAWWLEHARPTFWGRTKLDVTVTDERAEGEVQPDITERATAILDELARRREARVIDIEAVSG